jgi:hypothetical protein
MLHDYPEMRRYKDSSGHLNDPADGAAFLGLKAKKTLVTTGIMTRARDFG